MTSSAPTWAAASAGEEIASQIVHFIATTENFALAIEQVRTLPEELASTPVLLTELCDGLTRIAAIGRELSRATTYPRPESCYPGT